MMKPTIKAADDAQLLVTETSYHATIVSKPSYNITFHGEDGKQRGCLDFNGDAMKFTGDAEESAKRFFNWIAESFAGRLAEERAPIESDRAELIWALRELLADFDNELTPTDKHPARALLARMEGTNAR